MIHYHGGPITPLEVAGAVWRRRHGFVSFEAPDQVAAAFELCQSVALDNGSYTKWRRGGGKVDVKGFVAFVETWRKHPAFDWALIPDVIDGTTADNIRLVAEYREAGGDLRGSVPVWHMHESFDRLADLCHAYPRVALGSSGEWATVGTDGWWQRMGDAMDAICDDQGRPPCKLHGLRMLDPTIFSQLPLSSADSTNVAQNHARNRRLYRLTPTMGALFIVDRIESHASAPYWDRTFGAQKSLALFE